MSGQSKVNSALLSRQAEQAQKSRGAKKEESEHSKGLERQPATISELVAVNPDLSDKPVTASDEKAKQNRKLLNNAMQTSLITAIVAYIQRGKQNKSLMDDETTKRKIKLAEWYLGKIKELAAKIFIDDIAINEEITRLLSFIATQNTLLQENKKKGVKVIQYKLKEGFFNKAKGSADMGFSALDATYQFFCESISADSAEVISDEEPDKNQVGELGIAIWEVRSAYSKLINELGLAPDNSKSAKLGYCK